MTHSTCAKPVVLPTDFEPGSNTDDRFPLKESNSRVAGVSNVFSLGPFQWTAWTRRAQGEGYVSRGSATALSGGEGQDVRVPGPPAWTSALDTGLSWQTPEPAAVIPIGRAMTALQVSASLR